MSQLAFSESTAINHTRELESDAQKALVRCALEDESFPFEFFSDIAEAESWRKEINRPPYHIHKWWAQRLGSIFRAIVIGAYSEPQADLKARFYEKQTLGSYTVFDPFMGSGTTIGESLKLGAKAIGRDINPVAYFLVKNGLAKHDRRKILSTFAEIEADTAHRIQAYYKSKLPNGELADVLYYFWVKYVECPGCGENVDLFGSRIFAKHAYPKRYPKAHATCPQCSEVQVVSYNDIETKCFNCSCVYNPQEGAARGQNATCQSCGEKFSIAKTVKASTEPPSHRLYAKLVLNSDGTKEYLAANDADRALYESAATELSKLSTPYPVQTIEAGHNTNQAIGYNYRAWHQMFNDRQLLCLAILAERIKKIPETEVRELFACLFSGALEFNNMFASYKGEGTGAVRHMFAHHILKPERVPLEANLWGTKKSSGSFLTMFENRIRRALDYVDDPFELRVSSKKKNEKVFGISHPLGVSTADQYLELAEKRVYLSCGDSSKTDLPDGSVDAVITDPPFFDNVHYSELADFFYVWQQHMGVCPLGRTTRSAHEVQSPDVAAFTDRLSRVLVEARRVLKDDGLLAFTYHHSRPEGWLSVLASLLRAGFFITAVQPVKAEMSVAMPKNQAKEPIDLDIIIVCRKASPGPDEHWNVEGLASCLDKAAKQIERFARSGRRLSRNDVRIIAMGQLIRFASFGPDEKTCTELLISNQALIEERIEELYERQFINVEPLSEAPA